MTKIKMLLCAVFLAGCSAGIQPTFPDLGTPEADGATNDAPDSSMELDAGQDAGDPDAGADLGSPPDAGDPDPDLGPPPDAGPPACVPMTSPPVTGICSDGTCCAAACRSDGVCPLPVSGTFCTCFYMGCAGAEAECSFGDMVCPCR